MLDCQKLDVYRVAIEFHGVAMKLARSKVLRDQLERASSSIALNVAEGVGRATVADRRHFYVIARGSASECGAIVDLLRASEQAPADQCDRAMHLLIRIVQMLTKLQRAAPPERR